jgi:hypothetical protein
MREMFRFLEKVAVIALLVVFLKWYIKNHSGKYAVFFWVNTIFSLILFVASKAN